MSILRVDRSETIKNNQREAAAKQQKEPSETKSRKVALKKRMDKFNYQRELDAINRFEA